MKWLFAALSLILIWTQVFPNSPSWGSGLTVAVILFIWKNLQGRSNSSTPPPSPLQDLHHTQTINQQEDVNFTPSEQALHQVIYPTQKTSPPTPLSSPPVSPTFIELTPTREKVDKTNGKIRASELLQWYKDKKNLKGIDAAGSNLSQINLSGADLSSANLENANLSGAILRGADLKQANLKGADLSGASLDKANLYEANLSKARLQGTSLIETYLVRTNLKGAILTSTDLNTAVLCKTTDPSGIQLNKDCDELGIP